MSPAVADDTATTCRAPRRSAVVSSSWRTSGPSVMRPASYEGRSRSITRSSGGTGDPRERRAVGERRKTAEDGRRKTHRSCRASSRRDPGVAAMAEGSAQRPLQRETTMHLAREPAHPVARLYRTPR